MKKNKRILSGIVALCITVSLLPAAAAAEDLEVYYGECYMMAKSAEEKIAGTGKLQDTKTFFENKGQEDWEAKVAAGAEEYYAPGSTISIEYPSPIKQYADDGSLIATWKCVGYQLSDNDNTDGDEYYDITERSFPENGKPLTVTIPDNWTEDWYDFIFLWDIAEDPSLTVTYDLKSGLGEEYKDYTVYHAEDWGFNFDDEEIRNYGVPVCYFSGEGYPDTVTATAYADNPIEVGMGLSRNANYPIVDFVARKVENGEASYLQLTGWKIKDSDDSLGEKLYVQGEKYSVVADTTFVAQWESVDAPTANEEAGPKAPLAIPFKVDGVSCDAKIEQSLNNKDNWTTGEVQMQNPNDTIYYKASMKVNPLIADKNMLPSVNGKVADPAFAKFNIHVDLPDGLELCTENDMTEIRFKCEFLRPVAPENVSANDESSKLIEYKSYVIIDGKEVEATIEQRLPNFCVKVSAESVQNAKSLVLPVEWRPFARISNAFNAYDMDMTAQVKAKEGSTAMSYAVTGYVDGKIDLSKAKVAEHQVIRFILADSAWNQYYRGDNGVDIIDTLRATKQLEWALQNIALTANTVTAKPAYIPATGVTLDQTTLNLVSNDDAQKTAQLRATVTPDNATDKSVTWSSENPAVATVDNEGKVTAVSAGTAIIRVTAKDGKTAACQVTVTTNAEGVGLDKTEMALTLGGTVTGQLTATVSPDNATDKSVTWTSSDETIATVDGGVVRAVGTGTADVTASVTVNGTTYTAACKVTVTQPVTGISVNPAALNLTEGDARALTATVGPENATNRAVVWTSSNPSVAAVDGNGVVTALRAGSAVITATAIDGGGTSGSCTVVVSAYVDPFESYYPDYFNYPSNPGTTAPAQSTEPETPVIPDDPTPTDSGTEITDEEVPLSKIPLLFTDVKTGDWHRDAVAFVFSKGIMGGTSDTKFEPDSRINRGMVVTMLHRLEGTPVSALSAFTDVLADQYWAEAIGWASRNGIVQGYSDTEFRPTREITREQLASILYRYAQLKGYDTSEQTDLSAYADAADVSGYALDGMRWAVAKGLISGVTESTLAPGGSATRAQAAMILMRFCENVVSA